MATSCPADIAVHPWGSVTLLDVGKTGRGGDAGDGWHSLLLLKKNN